MTRKSIWLLGLLLGLLAPAHAADSNAGPVGTWQLLGQAGRLRIEFHENGEYRAITGHRILSGQWSLVDKSHIATWTSNQRPKRVNRFLVEGDNLSITDRNGIVHLHRRVSR